MGYSLLEAYKELKEDITSIKRLRDMYSKIDNETFTNLLKLDPTYNDSDTQSGIYANWILNKYNKGIIKNDDFENVTKALEFFNKHKNRFRNRDLNTYKTLQELEHAIEEVEAADPTKSQLKRMVQRTDLDKDAPLFMQTKNFDIYIPLTYEASCKLGTNTEWCTATRERRDYYDRYTRNDNKLYVMINRKNPQIKFQWNTMEDYTCDEKDTQLTETTVICRYPDLLNFYRKVGSKNIPDDIEKKIENYQLMSTKIAEYIHNGIFECYDECTPMLSQGPLQIGDEIIEKVIIKSNVKSLPDGAFDKWTNLKEIIFEEGIREIGDRAFRGTAINTITFPKTLKKIGDFVFDDCEDLETIILYSFIDHSSDEEPLTYRKRYVILSEHLQSEYEDRILENYSDNDNYCKRDSYDWDNMVLKDDALDWYFTYMLGTENYISTQQNIGITTKDNYYNINDSDIIRIKNNISWFNNFKDLAFICTGQSEELSVQNSYNYGIRYKLVNSDKPNEDYQISIVDGSGYILFGQPISKWTSFRSVDKLVQYDKEHENILHLFRLHALECLEALKERNYAADAQKIVRLTNLLKDFNY